MEDYLIEYVDKSHFAQIEEEWKVLEGGKDMTIFQSYEWNKMLVERYLPDDNRYYESRFVILRRKGEVVAIAPLWIVKKNFRLVNKKGIYFIGREGWSDYLNCIYDKFYPEAFAFLFNQVVEEYRDCQFVFEEIKESTEMYRYISCNYKNEEINKNPCVSITLPNIVEDYYSSLSKNSRQNLRTANNRLVKEGHEIVFNFDDTSVNKDKCAEIREKKMSRQYDKIPKFLKYKYRIKNKLYFHFGNYYPLYHYRGSKVMTAYIDGILCAFFNYVIDEKHKNIVVITAGTDLGFSRYSPGILLMYEFVKKVIENGLAGFVDFTRGNEKYKYTLGGSTFYNHNICFRV